jgi:hypothetical protein
LVDVTGIFDNAVAKICWLHPKRWSAGGVVFQVVSTKHYVWESNGDEHEEKAALE